MDNSTEGVTLLTQYVKNVIEVVASLNHGTDALLTITKGYDLSDIYEHIPMRLYNEVCDWVEQNLDDEVIIQVGESIGDTIYDMLVVNYIIEVKSSVMEIIAGVNIAASTTIKDPKERGWKIIKVEERHIVLQRTQTFNSKLQLGLLKGLVQRCIFVKEDSVSVNYLKEVSKGEEFDEYLITWESSI